jgi:hypothetical protein
MKNIDFFLTKLVSGATVVCRPSGQTYPAVICEGLPTPEPNPHGQAVLMGAVGGAIAGARGGAAGILLGATGGMIAAGAINDNK